MEALCLRNPGCPVQFAVMFAAVVFALTLLMIVMHPGEWLLLAQLARARPAGSPRGGTASPEPARSPLRRVLGLMNFLRFEAFYYLVLVVFWLVSGGAVPGVAVFLLGAIHVLGWAALEARKSMPELEVVAALAAHNPEAKAGGTRLRRLLAGIAAFDAAEVVVLVYLAYRLWPLV